MRFLILLLGTVLAFVVGFIPEAIMYWVYHLIAPASDVARILVFGVFWFGGASFCVIFAFFGFLIFMSALKAVNA